MTVDVSEVRPVCIPLTVVVSEVRPLEIPFTVVVSELRLEVKPFSLLVIPERLVEIPVSAVLRLVSAAVTEPTLAICEFTVKLVWVYAQYVVPAFVADALRITA